MGDEAAKVPSHYTVPCCAFPRIELMPNRINTFESKTGVRLSDLSYFFLDVLCYVL